MILGCDAAGVDEDGPRSIVHCVIATPDWRGDETLDPQRTLLSELHQGTLAERVAVPRAQPRPQARVALLRGGGVPADGVADGLPDAVRQGAAPARRRPCSSRAPAAAWRRRSIALGHQAGLRVWATSRDEAKRARAMELGADAAFEPGARLPERVDVVMETVGEATWKHSLARSSRAARSWSPAPLPAQARRAELNRMFFLQLRVLGSTMGTRDELEQLVRLLDVSGLRPRIDRVLPLADAREGFAAMAEGSIVGKIVFTP